MNIKKIELTIDNSRFIIDQSHPCAKPAGLRIRDDNGDYSATIDSGADDERCWQVAHDMYHEATGGRCCSGDVRSLQMILSLALP